MLMQYQPIILYSCANFNSFFPMARERDNFCPEMGQTGSPRKMAFFADGKEKNYILCFLLDKTTIYSII